MVGPGSGKTAGITAKTAYLIPHAYLLPGCQI
ncbi:hypothetical protein [Carboxydocella thermautotrophica]|nr:MULTISPECIES: hypothetical protein [Carboxydocella]